MDQDPLPAFKALVHSAGPKAKSMPPSKFVKKLDEIPSLELLPSEPCQLALTLPKKFLIGKFTGLWPSPKAVELWIADHCSPSFPGINNCIKKVPHQLACTRCFLDSAEPKGDHFTCARVCVEVNLEKGLPEALKLTVGDWSHIQELDYEQIPFKCNLCHAYGHFAKSCPKISEIPLAKDAEFQTVTNRCRSTWRKEPRAPQHKASETPPNAEATSPPLASKNSFEALQEVEVQGTAEETAAEAPLQGKNPPDPSGPPESVSADHTPKATPPVANRVVRPLELETSVHACSSLRSSSKSEGNFESEGFPAASPPLTRGRKTNKERRENEAVTNILLGSQKKLDPFIKGRIVPPSN